MTSFIEWPDFKGRTHVVDLSVLTGPTQPSSPQEGQSFVQVPIDDYESPGGDYIEFIQVHDDHTGTHVDAPIHYIPPPERGLDYGAEIGRVTVDLIPLDQMMGNAAVIDARPLIKNAEIGSSTHLKESPEIDADYIRNWEEQHGRLGAAEIVLFFTGWSDEYYRPYPEGHAYDRSHPAPSVNAYELLAERGVTCVGIDTRGIGLMQDDTGPHRAALGRNIVAVENLTNLGAVPPRGAFFIFLPHKFEGASGGMGRAIALVPHG